MSGTVRYTLLTLIGSLLLAAPASAEILLHLDARDLSATLNDGDAVSTWGSLSQADVNRQPIYRETGLNGMASVDFDGMIDGTGDYLDGAAVNGASSVVAVTIFEGSRSLATLISNGNDGLNIRRNETTNYYRSEGNGAADQNEFYRHGITVGNPVDPLANVYVNGVGSGAFVAGESHVALSNAASSASFGNFTIGRAASDTAGAANRYWDGDVAEIYVFSQTLTADEIAGVSSILADRWGSAAVSATPEQIAAGQAVLGIVPEPSTVVLLLIGALTLAGFRRHWAEGK